MSADARPSLSERQITAAAYELSSQERYNPAWCHPGKGINDTKADLDHYRMRAFAILEAAMKGA